MKNVRGLKVALAALTFALGCLETAGTSDEVDEESEAILSTSPRHKPRVVLIHGAFADATGWQHVIPLLERRGYPVTAVQNPLTSIADDVATTKRVLDAESQKGPVIAVAHSFGGWR
jgi:pimeloyl-ACP methyl ester carboxylesterase